MSVDPDRNKRVQVRYDELMGVGRHGHYETLFQLVKEEVERERAKFVSRPTLAAGKTLLEMVEENNRKPVNFRTN